MVGIGLNSANALYDPECKLRKYLQEGYTLLNEISSPKVRKLQDSGTAISRILDDVANDIIAEME